MKRRRTVRITNTPGGDDGCRLNPDSSSVIYMTAVKEDQLRIVAENRRKQDEVKQNTIQETVSKGKPVSSIEVNLMIISFPL